MTANRRPRPDREAPELGAAVDRMLRALVRRATAGDLFALEELARLEREVRVAVTAAGRGAHDGPAHYSWTEVANELGVTRQAARERFGA
jgi:predicted DNA binding protein